MLVSVLEPLKEVCSVSTPVLVALSSSTKHMLKMSIKAYLLMDTMPDQK